MTREYDDILDEQIFCGLIVAGKIENRLTDRRVANNRLVDVDS